jgi:hypothetical protein
MNKFVLSSVVLAVLAIALGTTGFVYAQSPTPQTPVPGTGYSQGMMNGQGNRGRMSIAPASGAGMNQNAAGTQDGLLHDAMMAVYAEKLGITVEDLNTRLVNGETMAQIASSKGLTADQFSALMVAARSQAIDLAVKNGTLTQAQADWMKQHGVAIANGGRGMRGSGQGRNANPDCPYYQANP